MYLLTCDIKQKRYAETFWKWENVPNIALNGMNTHTKPLIPANAFDSGLWKHYKKAGELSDEYLVVDPNGLSGDMDSDKDEIVITPAVFDEDCYDIDFVFKKKSEEEQFRISCKGLSLANILWAREPEYTDRMTRKEFLVIAGKELGKRIDETNDFIANHFKSRKAEG